MNKKLGHQDNVQLLLYYPGKGSSFFVVFWFWGFFKAKENLHLKLAALPEF